MKTLKAYVPVKLLAVVLVVYLIVAGYQWINRIGDTTVTAYFSNTSGLYKGDFVEVQGVPVGSVTGIHPGGSNVRVTLRVDGSYKIPAGASAAIVSPSLVSGDYVQLAPAYTGGPVMASGATISQDRTAVPVSFDDVKSQLIQLSTALAPQGASSPLRSTINALQANLQAGNATELSNAIKGLNSAATTLADGRGDLFSTISNLSDFTQNLAVNDAAISGFTNQLSAVSAVLATNRTQLTAAIASLAHALGTTGSFLTANRTTINNTVRDLNLLSAALADRSNQLAGVLHVAPTAVDDLYNIIQNQAITATASLSGLTNVPELICGAILGAGGSAQQCTNALSPLQSLESLLKSAQTTTSGASAASGASGLSGLLGSNGLSGTLSGLNSLLPGLLGTTLGALK